MRFRLVVDGEAHDIDLRESPKGTLVTVDGATYRARVSPSADGMAVRVGKATHRLLLRGSSVDLDGRPYAVVVEAMEEERAGGVAGGTVARLVEVRPPMPGRVVKLSAQVGSAVRRGQVLAVLEAMKMQNEIVASVEGIVESVAVKEGESIGADRVIALIRTGTGAA